MAAYILRRLLMTIPVVIGILLVTFAMKSLIPTDAVTALYSGTVSEDKAAEAIDQMRDKYGLNDAWYVQFAHYIADVARGDLGTSIRTRQPVAEEIGYRYVNTMILTAAALVVALIVGLSTGIVSAYWRGSWIDELSMSVGLLGISMPAFFFGLALIFIFAVQLQWLPVINSGGWQGLILPALSLGIIEAAPLSRITRASMVEVLEQDYIKALRAKGITEAGVIFHHALPNALLSILTILGLQIGGLLGGAFIIEVVFGWHGIGELAVKAIGWRDFVITQAIILVSAGTYVLVNLIVDILYAWVDPRISLR
ncbi:MAG: peptide ABC transporter permease [Rhodobacteraceae bacterium]|nr:peptide ABC transporter permease [Paracoccaceae bacterium]QEW18964.1 ABC-transporter permease protein [Marinibacterium anthonyi]